MDEYINDLNEEQRQAVMATEGMVRIVAGAGSGKTRALSSRFAFLVNEIGILPGNILCVTFTNKAANEMRQRIHQLTGDNDTGYINTFHGFCVSVLQEDSHVVQYPKSFLVLDNSDIDTMLQTVYEERGLTLRDMTFSRARDMIEMIKLKERPRYYLDMIGMSLEELYDKYRSAETAKDIIFYGYLYQEKKCFGLDYNDLLKYTLYIFEQNESVKKKWQQRLEYIMIDEFQDIDQPQYELMEVLCGYHGNLFIVGDPDQTIYSWRGASGRYLMEFAQTHKDVQTIMMMCNYRSSPQILHAVNSLIARNRDRIPKDLIPMTEEGPKPLVHRAVNSEGEARWIAEKILCLQEQGRRLSDIAILYRGHYVSRAIEEGLLKEKIPYTIYSGVQFFGRAEIKDALSYLRMIAYQDDLSFLRVCNVPKRNLGKRRIAFLKEYAAAHGTSLYEALKQNLDSPDMKGTRADQFVKLIDRYAAEYEGRQISDLLSALLNDSGYEKMLRTEGSQERLDNLAELKQSIYDYEASCGEETELEHYLAHVALFSNTDTSEQPDKVKLMTVHAAKGLEFPCVILCGMSEGIFPSRKINTRDEMEEERRLAFVAMTRAEKELILTMSEGRNIDGSPKYPSRFVLDIDQDLLEYSAPLREDLIKEARHYIDRSTQILKDEEELKNFEVGQRVEHFLFGKGVVRDVDLVKKAHIVLFDDMDTPRSISFRAKLTAIEED
ncbi:MAG: UvrD-helicase domain-containing protein [Firmicutes bacterium]|nr:UvrD-helicase domain-containing protein [Bacillota bacterium]